MKGCVVAVDGMLPLIERCAVEERVFFGDFLVLFCVCRVC